MAEKSDIEPRDVIVEAGLADFTDSELTAIFKKDFNKAVTDRIREAEVSISDDTGYPFTPLNEDPWITYNMMVRWLAAIACINVVLANQSLFSSIDVQGFARFNYQTLANNLRTKKHDLARDLKERMEKFISVSIDYMSFIATEVD